MVKPKKANSLMLRLKNPVGLTPAADPEARMARDLAQRDRRKTPNLVSAVRSASQKVATLYPVAI